MGVGRVIATAAAATPLVRNYLHQNSEQRQASHAHPDAEDYLYSPVATTTPIVASQVQERRESHPELVQSLTHSLTQNISEPPVEHGEMARRPLLGVDATRQSSLPGYGTILGGEGSASLRASPERIRRGDLLDRVPEEDGGESSEDEEAEEWDLEQQGYYSGSYKRTVALYALVPLTSLLLFILLALIPTWFWSTHTPHPPTIPRSLPHPLPAFLLSAGLWSLSHLLRVPLYSLSSLLCPRILDTLLFSILHVFLAQFLRLAALGILRVRHEMAYPRPTWRDAAFGEVWWLALGWAVAEAAVSVAQGYEQLALYRNVMIPVEKVKEILAQTRGAGSSGYESREWGIGSVTSLNASREYMPLSPRSEDLSGVAGNGGGRAESNGSDGGRKHAISLEEAIKLAVDQDVEQLIHLQEREELEEVYGLPVIYIPVFVPCLQRIDSFLFSLGFTLILSWAYLLSPLSFPSGYEPPAIYSNHALEIVFPVVVLVHLFLSLLHSPPILPRIGVHTTAYIGVLVGLGVFFTGLGLWGALS